jgi:hypothetical protein
VAVYVDKFPLVRARDVLREGLLVLDRAGRGRVHWRNQVINVVVSLAGIHYLMLDGHRVSKARLVNGQLRSRAWLLAQGAKYSIINLSHQKRNRLASVLARA